MAELSVGALDHVAVGRLPERRDAVQVRTQVGWRVVDEWPSRRDREAVGIQRIAADVRRDDNDPDVGATRNGLPRRDSLGYDGVPRQRGSLVPDDGAKEDGS